MAVINEFQDEEEAAAATATPKITTKVNKYEEVAAATIARFQKDEEVAAAKKISQFQRDKGNGLIKPNAENGLDLETYSWTQRLPEVNVTVPIPKGTEASFVICEIEKDYLKVGLKDQFPIIDGELHQPVKVGECFWSIEDGQTLSILLTKQNHKEWWKSLVKSDPEIDIRNVKAITDLSELDPESRETIQKILTDQHRRKMGLPTSDEIQKQELLRNLMAQHPKMV